MAAERHTAGKARLLLSSLCLASIAVGLAFVLGEIVGVNRFARQLPLVAVYRGTVVVTLILLFTWWRYRSFLAGHASKWLLLAYGLLGGYLGSVLGVLSIGLFRGSGFQAFARSPIEAGVGLLGFSFMYAGWVLGLFASAALLLYGLLLERNRDAAG